jgi:hypothetical protein
MPSKQQLETALINADKAGDIDAAIKLATALKSGQYEQAQGSEQPSEFVTSGSGFNATQLTDAISGRKQMTPEIEGLEEVRGAPELNELSGRAFKGSLGLLTESDDQVVKGVLKQQFGDSISFRKDEKGNEIATLPSGEYVLNKPGLTRQDVLRGIFDAVAFLPSSRGPGIIASGVKGMVTQGGIEAAGESVGGDFDSTSVALSGAINVGGKAAENTAGAVFRGITGSPASEAVEAASTADIPVMTSDVLPPQTFAGKSAQQIGEKIPFIGTGPARANQQQARVEAVDKFLGKYQEFSYTEIIDSLKASSHRVKQAAGSVLESNGKKLDEIALSGGLPLLNTESAIKNANALFNKPGVIPAEGAKSNLAALIDALQSPQNFTTLKENRTALRDMVDAVDPAGRSQLPSRAKAQLRKIESAMKKDMDVFAKANLDSKSYNQWTKANSAYFSEAQKLKSAKFRNVFNTGDLTPENVETLLFSRKPSEVKALYKSLTPKGRANARAAIINKAVSNLSKRVNGLTPNSFVTEMKKLGFQTEAFFKGAEKRELDGLMRALDATKRAQDAGIANPNGQQVLTLMGIGSAVSFPKSTLAVAGGAGALAQAYESKAVRNALLRLASAPKGSTKFERALAEFQTAFVLAGQAGQNQ